MRKKYLYIIFSAIALVSFCSCMENESSDSNGGKRALDDNPSETQAVTEVTEVTTVTTFRPLETFVRITEMQNKYFQKSETRAVKQETDVTETDAESEWFSENKLFDIEIMDKQDSEYAETWYRFSDENEQTETTVTQIKEKKKQTETTATQIKEKKKHTEKTVTKIKDEKKQTNKKQK